MGKSSNKVIRIGVDVDDVIGDFKTDFVSYFKSMTGLNLLREDLNKWNLKELITELFNGEVDGEIANDIIKTESFIRNMQFKKDSKETLIKMCTNPNIDVVIVTALYPEMKIHRDSWLDEHFGDYKFEKHYTSKKHEVHMDYLIDDGVQNLEALEPYIGFDNCLRIIETHNTDSRYRGFDSLKEAYEYILRKENL